MSKFYITTAIDYVNAPPHLGHAWEKVVADALARFRRLMDDEVYFLTGTDENGLKIVQSASQKGKEVKDFVEENVLKFKELIEKLNISNDDFIRTSDKKRHWPSAQFFWKKLEESGDIYKSKYKGYYCVGCEAYITEKDLEDGKCPYHNKEPEIIEEDNYFFKLSKYASEIKRIIQNEKVKILPASRKNEVLAMIDRGIEDISFSRPAEKLKNWGVPVPDDNSQVMYVWCDALTNYVSALGFGTENDENFKKFWPADVHIIGKDILRFHAIVWIGMLLSAGLPLPKHILVHGHILSGGQKMSKTIGNVIDPFELIGEYNTDAVRYFLLRQIPFFDDGDITRERFKEVYNADLANGLGNTASRVLKMTEMYLEERCIPKEKSLSDFDEFVRLMESFQINQAMDYIWEKVSGIDMYIQETQPFKLIKEDKGKAQEIVRNLLDRLYEVAILLQCFLPETSEKILSAIQSNKSIPPLFLRK